jgi:selenocysteine lyase/cysteine desulfurase
VSAYLAEKGLFVSHGDFYASTVVERLGVSEQGLVRIGLSVYSTAEEIDRLLAGVREFVSEHR